VSEFEVSLRLRIPFPPLREISPKKEHFQQGARTNQDTLRSKLTPMFDVEGFILVGGASSRMGTDKAQLVFDGLSSIERIAAELSSVASSVNLVGSRHHYRHLSLKNVPDIHPGWGALGGIHAALAACERDWALVVACDLPFVTKEFFERLKGFRGQQVDAVVPIQADGRPQPLCALYRRNTCLVETEKLIEMDEHTPRALLRSVKTHWLEFAELRDLPGANNFFLNINTPADFEEATKRLAREAR
jgi:molybdenum cofactor guanylyltransferase